MHDWDLIFTSPWRSCTGDEGSATLQAVKILNVAAARGGGTALATLGIQTLFLSFRAHLAGELRLKRQSDRLQILFTVFLYLRRR